MFTSFRHNVKCMLKEKGLTYAAVAKKANLSEGSIKLFMCGDNDSRRVAEKIADVLGMGMSYSNGIYELTEKRSVR